MNFETIILEKKEGIATILFNRPKVFNAYSETMSQELRVAVKDVGDDDSVRILILKGSGDNFMAGADINMLNSFMEKLESE